MKSATVMAQASLDFCAFAQRATGSAAPTTARMGKVGGGTPSVVCTQCHDYEQSPDFDYQKRWPLIEHGKTKAKAR